MVDGLEPCEGVGRFNLGATRSKKTDFTVDLGKLRDAGVTRGGHALSFPRERIEEVPTSPFLADRFYSATATRAAAGEQRSIDATKASERAVGE